jgi:hypothetical protein
MSESLKSKNGEDEKQKGSNGIKRFHKHKQKNYNSTP